MKRSSLIGDLPMLESEATPPKPCKIPYYQTAMARCSTAGHLDAWMKGF